MGARIKRDRRQPEHDIDILFAAIRAGSSDGAFELDGDGEVSNDDADYWIVELAKTRPGDLNLDGKVDFDDFLRLAAKFGKQDAGWSDGDVDGDGDVTFDDFLRLAAEFGFSAEE